MEKELSILPLITARGGSKGLPGKNIMQFHGHPLIAWTIEAIKASSLNHSPVVSTDSIEIQRAAAMYGAEVPFVRPAPLSSDEATSIDVALHALDFYRDSLNKNFDAVFLFQPTSPIRDFSKINSMITKLTSDWNKFDAVIAVGEAKPSPAHSLVEQGEYLTFTDLFDSRRRQEQVKYFASYGNGWLVKTKTLREERTFYPHKIGHVVCDKFECVDIDDEFDFDLASQIYERVKEYKTIKVPEIM